MQLRYFVYRFTCLLLVTFSYGLQGFAQKYHYSDAEQSFNIDKEAAKLLAQPDGTVHLWRWGMHNAVLSIYDAALKLTSNTKISDISLNGALFLQFDSCYYIWARTLSEGKLYRVKDGMCTDQSAVMEQLPDLYAVLPYKVVKSGKALCFIHWAVNVSTNESAIVVTAVDEQLRQLGTYHFPVNCDPLEHQNLRANAVNDQLFLMMSTSIHPDTATVEIRAVNTTTGEKVTKTFCFTDKWFYPRQVSAYANGYFLEGLSRDRAINQLKQLSAYSNVPFLEGLPTNAIVHSKIKNQSSYRVLKLDSALQVTGEFYSGPADKETILLPNQTLLLYGRERSFDFQKTSDESKHFYLLLDTSFQVLHSVTKPIGKNTNLVSYVLNKESEVVIFYEEALKSNRFALHRFLLTEDSEDDRILQLWPKFRYVFTHAVRTADNTFVMPYLHNYRRMGVVQIKLKD